MKKTKHLLMSASIIMFLLSIGQPIGAQEWKSLSNENGLGTPSVKSLLQLPSWVKREISGQNKTEISKDPPQHYTGQDLLRFNSDQTREYGREGSWAPLAAKPGEENFQLFTF